MTTQSMTAEAARSFERAPSSANSAALADVAALKGCECAAYVDWFTYRRWQAQGMQVQKGEKGTKLPTFYTETETDDRGNTQERRRMTRSALFCRCQVQPK